MFDQAWFLSTVAARTAIVLIALVFGIRFLARQGLGTMNLIDVAMILLIGNAVQNAMTYGSGRLAVGLIAALVLLLLDRQVGALVVARPWLERLLTDDPAVLVTDGEMDRAAMRREEVTEEEVMAACREMGLARIDQVRLAMLEPNGEISVIPKDRQEAGNG
jgi:uncharacterized membrane protein YcaP (DUF421 family)